MKILITGICGFVGNSLATILQDALPDVTVFGIDNLSRPGSERNRLLLRRAGVALAHGDLRCASDFDALPDVDWVIDAAANPSVLAGVDRRSTPRQLVEHNLLATVNILEYCRRVGAGLILLSTSRVYSIPLLAALPLEQVGRRFVLIERALPPGVSLRGIAECFSTAPPLSIYGSTKLASEQLALEYASAFSFPVWVNRCGVLAGAGQFGTAEQGIFSFWLHAWRAQEPLRYIGFGGLGAQVRDALHTRDLGTLVLRQMQAAAGTSCPRICNVAGGEANSMSLAELSAWCTFRFGARSIAGEPQGRTYDIPWLILDCDRAERHWQWRPTLGIDAILQEIAEFADENPDWLELARP